MNTPLPLAAHFKLCIATLLCTLSVAVMENPSIGTNRGLLAYAISLGYAVTVIVQGIRGGESQGAAVDRAV